MVGILGPAPEIWIRWLKLWEERREEETADKEPRRDLKGKSETEDEMKKVGPDLEQRAVVANVRHNMKRLEQATPILAEMVAEKKLGVVGAVYDLPTGKVALV